MGLLTEAQSITVFVHLDLFIYTLECLHVQAHLANKPDSENPTDTLTTAELLR